MRNDHSNVQLDVTSVYVLNDYKKVLVESAPHPIKKFFVHTYTRFQRKGQMQRFYEVQITI